MYNSYIFLVVSVSYHYEISHSKLHGLYNKHVLLFTSHQLGVSYGLSWILLGICSPADLPAAHSQISAVHLTIVWSRMTFDDFC